MGCDIHCYIEYRSENSDFTSWNDFGKKINPGRNYQIFGLMAKGVRADYDESLDIKGLPDYETLGYSSKDDAYIYISESKDPDCCSLETAQKWESYGHKIIYRNGNPIFVENPDWHSHSWLTTEEFNYVLNLYYQKNSDSILEPYEYMKSSYIAPEYEAILAAMLRFEDLGYKARLVFWFDN